MEIIEMYKSHLLGFHMHRDSLLHPCDHSSAQPCTKIIICGLQLWSNKTGCSIKEDFPVLYVMLCHISSSVNTGVHTGTGVDSDLVFWASGKHHPQTPGMPGVASTPVSTLVLTPHLTWCFVLHQHQTPRAYL
jgi:hypothetical protein